jgi:predicted lipoprotein with Yx(FWY)xxD motif
MRTRSVRALALVAALTFVAAGCGDDDDAGTSDTTAAPSAEETTSTTAAPADAAATVEVASTDLGDVLVDAEGRTLYIFTKDVDGEPTCAGDCAANWPAALVDGDVVAGDGVTAELATVAALAGGQQVTAGGQPLYLFAGDAAAGDVNGQGVGGVWWAVAPDGTAIETAAG